MDTMFYYSLPIFFTCLLCLSNHQGVGAAIGINYGLLGNNLPPTSAVRIQLEQIKVTKIRIFEPNKDVLTALHYSNIEVIIGVYNPDLKQLASGVAAATKWVGENIVPHLPYMKITYVAVGNEVDTSEELYQYLPAAMQNIETALGGLVIPVTTAISMKLLSASYPPSAGAFSDQARPVMAEVASFLSSRKYPLLVNVYPYFPRVGDPTNVALDYALFESGSTVVTDGPYTYTNLFDSMLDATYAALEKVGAPDVEIVVTETGWPSAGGSDASVQNAQTYVNNLIDHVTSGNGTPRRPGKAIETYIFAMFNENQKAEGVEQHWGLYYPDLTQVYQVNHF